MKLQQEDFTEKALELSLKEKVQLLDGTYSMYDICTKIGVDKLIEYFYIREVLKPKGKRSVKDPFELKRIVHSRDSC